MAKYYQSNPPAEAQPAEDWVRSSDLSWFIRNIAGTAWRYIGKLGDPHLGAMPKSGGVVFQGTIEGPSGLLMSATMKAQMSAKSKGIELASEADLKRAKYEALLAASSKISDSFTSFNGGTSAKRKIAVGRGVFSQKADGDKFVIPLPSYLDGSGDTADESACAWAAGIQRVQFDGLTVSDVLLDETSNRNYTVTFGTSGALARVDVAYIIIGIRS